MENFLENILETGQDQLLSPKDFYWGQIQEINSRKKRVEEENKRLVVYRFLIFFGGLAGVIALVLNGRNESIILLALVILLYLWVLKRHQKIMDQLESFQRELNAYDLEIKALEGNQEGFDPGSEFMEANHAYSGDLDIFGNQSVFQFFNRTLTDLGKETLAQWFKMGASPSLISTRQNAVEELSRNPIWMMKFRSLGRERFSKTSMPKFIQWLEKEPNLKISPKTAFYIKWVPVLLLILALVSILDAWMPGILGFQGNLSWKLNGIMVLLFMINFNINKNLSNLSKHAYYFLSNHFKSMESYRGFSDLVENKTWESESLKNLQENFLRPVPVSKAFKELGDILSSFDRRSNNIIALISNGIYLADLVSYRKFHQWKEKYGPELREWIKCFSEWEALISLGILGFNHPDWVYPKISATKGEIKGLELGHPLIPEHKVIKNPIQINPPCQLLLVTGSNMAGKSTYLRTIGVNMVLAQMGSKVFAKEFQVFPFSLYTSLRIVDSLQENTSSFYAELKRIEILIQKTERKEPIFFLLDEILRGTNSHDRHIGSKSIIKHLIKSGSTGILATHDLGLGELEKVYPEEMENWHFDVSVKQGELFFDYTLKPGICRSLNASILMEKIGLKLEE